MGGGFISVAAVFWHQKTVDVIETGKGKGFIHAQTYQGSPLQAIVVNVLQCFFREENLVEKSAEMGAYIKEELIKAIGNHPHVGDIRGTGLFIAVEMVVNKITKEPFHPSLNIGQKITSLGLRHPYNISLYPGSGCVDGIRGDHFIISPAYNITKKDADLIVARVSALIHDAFKQSTYFQRKFAAFKNK